MTPDLTTELTTDRTTNLTPDVIQANSSAATTTPDLSRLVHRDGHALDKEAYAEDVTPETAARRQARRERLKGLPNASVIELECEYGSARAQLLTPFGLLSLEGANSQMENRLSQTPQVRFTQDWNGESTLSAPARPLRLNHKQAASVVFSCRSRLRLFGDPLAEALSPLGEYVLMREREDIRVPLKMQATHAQRVAATERWRAARAKPPELLAFWHRERALSVLCSAGDLTLKLDVDDSGYDGSVYPRDIWSGEGQPLERGLFLSSKQLAVVCFQMCDLLGGSGKDARPNERRRYESGHRLYRAARVMLEHVERGTPVRRPAHDQTKEEADEPMSQDAPAPVPEQAPAAPVMLGQDLISDLMRQFGLAHD